MRINFLFIIFILIIAIGCDNNKSMLKANKFSDVELQKIYTSSYNRQLDSLYPYFSSPNARYRAESALAFSSIKDSLALPKLYVLLTDISDEVRSNCAFAIGQIKSESAEAELIKACSVEKKSQVKKVMLEALGRVSTKTGLDFLTRYSPTDSLTEAGRAWGIYRASLKKVTSDEASGIMALMLDKKKSFEVRLAAGHYFSRSRMALTQYEKTLIEAIHNESEADVRMVFVRSLKNCKTENARETLLEVLKTDVDYRVRVEAVNASRVQLFDSVYSTMWHTLFNDKHVSVRIAASEYFMAVTPTTKFEIPVSIDTIDNWRIKSNLFSAALKHNSNAALFVPLLKKQLTSTSSFLEKKMVISILISEAKEIQFVVDYLKTEYDREVILAAAYAFDELLQRKALTAENEKVFREGITQFFETENPYLIREAAHFITNPAIDFRTRKSLVLEITKAKERMKSQSDQSITRSLDKAISYLNSDIKVASGNWDAEYFEEPTTFESFNWAEIAAINKDQKLEVSTTKGSFTMQLLVEEAPFTVAHFIQLAQRGFFDNLAFYRVIPNFVNQTGGAKNASVDSLATLRIRSEFAPTLHRTATVNMASSGRDTESSHFSFMLCPTPWNDNNYTIFAKVISNMEVVHSLELGDQILAMKLVVD